MPHKHTEQCLERISALIDGEGSPFCRLICRFRCLLCPECRAVFFQLLRAKTLVRHHAPRPEVPSHLWQSVVRRLPQTLIPSTPPSILGALAGALALLVIFAVAFAGLRPSDRNRTYMQDLNTHFVGHQAAARAEPNVELPSPTGFPVDLHEFGLMPVYQGSCSIGDAPAYCYVYYSASDDTCAVVSRAPGVCECLGGTCPSKGPSPSCFSGSCQQVAVLVVPTEQGCLCLSLPASHPKLYAIQRALLDSLHPVQ